MILTLNTWTTHKTILTVCLSHIDKIMQAQNELGSGSATVHPLPIHLHHITKYIKKPLQNIYNE